MRLIDADALKEKAIGTDYVPTWLWLRLSDLESAPTIDATKWNLCEKEMPLYPNTYLVTIKEKYSFEKEWRFHVDVADVFGSEIDNFWNTYNDWNEGQEIHVIAWADLPDPYVTTKETDL